MNLAFHIAKRIAFNRQKTFSRFIIRLSITATALSVMAMIITLSFVNGFQRTVSEKVFNFWGHVRVQKYEPNKSLVAEETAINKDASIEALIRQDPDVLQLQSFATKSAVLEKNKEIEGVLLKGIERDYDSSRLHPYLSAGRWIRFDTAGYSKEILLSQQLAAQLKIDLSDTITVYFISGIDGARTYRKLSVVGIYKTGIEEYDKLFVLGDLDLIRRVNDWAPDQTGGYEIFLKEHSSIDSVSNRLSDALPAAWMSRSIREVYPNIFDWLSIQDMNRNVIFIVMSVVAIINLITCLLILILERTRMVGILKALGAEDGLIRKVFLYHATVITFTGIGTGFILGIGLCLLQQVTGFITLDEASYYVSTAPVHIIWWQIVLVCIATAVVCYLALIIPTWLIKKIEPVKAIQFR
ncbi:MAG: ABC transporter permease [Chitinophagaceae bacterium]|nr:ABC transporter permease [Chitinophagaceae bacterium]MCA6452809.1 ABC transporter permease [Chitinophagaceae bacterium]MCA6456727.1 ABC transporter permease [Chitinophagaceae bacterium]MCA6459487.1 ABC transporter permease [Chitinophagaceae bacterium]MCA6464709.1 ABC transporter permease [Chitinophagaceae bacterium]